MPPHWGRWGSSIAHDYSKVKWSSTLKIRLKREQAADFDRGRIRSALYRPFQQRWLYYDNILIDRPGMFRRIFPAATADSENACVVVAGPGDRKGFGCLVTKRIVSLDLAFEKVQCFPFYVYDEDGSN